MVQIPFPLSSAPGKRPHEGAGRLVNAYVEPLGQGARSQYVWRRSPGLLTFATNATDSGDRGRILVSGNLYNAYSGKLVRFDSAGTRTSISSSLTGTRKVFFARNMKATTPDQVVVDPDNGAWTFTTSTITSYNAGGVLPQPNSVSFLDGYFFFTVAAGQCYASDLNATTMNALNFITCEGRPGTLYRAIPFTDLYLMGSASIEVWHNTAEAVGFPFSRIKVIPVGIVGPYAVSGYEDGFAKGIVFVGSDHVVYALNGYAPVKISTPDVDRAIASFIFGGGDGTTIEMFPYIVRGHSCIVVKCSAFTWVFDLDTLQWHERASYGLSYWRITGAYHAFDKWIGGDTESGNLVSISETATDEFGHPLVYQVESGPVNAFPYRMTVAQATFDIARGVGIASGSDPSQTDPSVQISYSDNGGISWSDPLIRKLGRQQEIGGPVKVVKQGMSKNEGRRWRLVVTDAVDVELTGGDQSEELRNTP